MSQQCPSSKYYLTKEKKLEIHEGGKIFRAKVPVRFSMSVLEMFKNLFYSLIKSKKKLRSYEVTDQKDDSNKTIYLTHSEIQQVWNQPLKEKPKKDSIIKKGMNSTKKRRS